MQIPTTNEGDDRLIEAYNQGFRDAEARLRLEGRLRSPLPPLVSADEESEER